MYWSNKTLKASPSDHRTSEKAKKCLCRNHGQPCIENKDVHLKKTFITNRFYS